jgi:uncharacterized membrane protein SirB2
MTITYLTLKHLHMSCAAISISLFILRGTWRLRLPHLLRQRWVKIVPHVVDTLLLTSAVTLALWSHQYPIQQNWLSAKIVALVLYIGMGAPALKRARTVPQIVLATCAAMLVFAYIVAVAVTKNVLPI